MVGVCSAAYFLQVEVHLVYCMVVLQKRGIIFFQLKYNLLCAVEMLAGITALIFQAEQIRVHQGTVGIKIKAFVVGVVTQRIEFAAKGFVLAHGATLRTQVRALLFYTYAAYALLLVVRQSDFEGWVACLDIATSLAFGTVVKQHAFAPGISGIGAA